MPLTRGVEDMCATGFTSAEGEWALRRRDGGPGASYTAARTFILRSLRKGTGRASGTPRPCHPAATRIFRKTPTISRSAARQLFCCLSLPCSLVIYVSRIARWQCRLANCLLPVSCRPERTKDDALPKHPTFSACRESPRIPDQRGP